jgi:hypothetical protein
MPNPNVIVSAVSSIEPAVVETLRFDPLPDAVTVRFEDGQAARLSPDDPRSAVFLQVLDRLRRARLTAYVEREPAGRRIVDVLIPLADRVMRLSRLHSGDVEVDFLISAAVHTLRSDVAYRSEMFAALSGALETGTEVLVTASVQSGVIDVRLVPENQRSLLEFTTPAVCRPQATRPVIGKVAQDMFDLVNSKSCNPASPAAPCVPFLDPKDGCHLRAHRMAQAIIAAGEEPAKLWIYGRMQVPTVNRPCCEADWGYHVVVTLAVETEGSPIEAIIDPSLFFSGPASRDDLIKALGNPLSLAFCPTSAHVFFRDSYGATLMVPSDSEIDQGLEPFRTELLAESGGKPSPPPFPQCQVRERVATLSGPGRPGISAESEAR